MPPQRPKKSAGCAEGANSPSTGAAPATAVRRTSELAVHNPVFPPSAASLDEPSPAVRDPSTRTSTPIGGAGAGGPRRGRSLSPSQASPLDGVDVAVTRSRSRSNSEHDTRPRPEHDSVQAPGTPPSPLSSAPSTSSSPRPVGRPRGRSPRANAAAPHTAAAAGDVVRRRVGRPRKDGASTRPARHTAASEKRGPGRPRKGLTPPSTPPVGGGGGSSCSGSPLSITATAAPVTPPASATSDRRPGRPRKNPPPPTPTARICPTTGDIADDIIDSGAGAPHDFSVTIGDRTGGNIRESVFKDGCDWMTKRAVRGVTSMERGDINGNLHLQGIWTLGLKKDYGDTKKEEAALRRKLRVDCGWTAAEKVKITIKRLVKQQTFSGMVGYVSKDEGRSHFKTVTKGVSRTEVNIALAEYRTLQRSVVSELRTDVGKKNFWGVLRRFKQEHLRGISVSPVQLVVWYINDGEGMPSHTWICPTSAYAMEAARADAYFTALMTPSLFSRKDGYLLFFSGGQGGRISSSFEKWDYQDREFADLTVDQAKACSHDRLELEGAMDIARERVMRDIAESHAAPAGVLNFPVNADSDADDEDNATPQPTALRQWDRIGRTAADTSSASEDLPLIVCPKCVEPGCTNAGNIAMLSCDLCEGYLHRSCGVRGGEEDADSDVVEFQGIRCSPCSTMKTGKKKSRTRY